MHCQYCNALYFFLSKTKHQLVSFIAESVKLITKMFTKILNKFVDINTRNHCHYNHRNRPILRFLLEENEEKTKQELGKPKTKQLNLIFPNC